MGKSPAPWVWRTLAVGCVLLAIAVWLHRPLPRFSQVSVLLMGAALSWRLASHVKFERKTMDAMAAAREDLAKLRSRAEEAEEGLLSQLADLQARVERGER